MAEALDNLGKDPGKVKMREGENAEEEDKRDGKNNEEDKTDGNMEGEEEEDGERMEKEREQELTGRQDGWFSRQEIVKLDSILPIRLVCRQKSCQERLEKESCNVLTRCQQSKHLIEYL